jgi:hypothetical protein
LLNLIHHDSIKKCTPVYAVDGLEVKLSIPKRFTDAQLRMLEDYFREMPIEEILTGLKFAKNRWSAKDAGVLKVGRKSIIQKEVHSVTNEQAQWRLKNWKMMISNYRRRGYSYPTISRIKKILIEKSKKKSK